MKNHILSILILSILSTGVVSGQNYLDLLKNQDYEKFTQLLSHDVNIKVGKNKRVTGPTKGTAAIKAYLSKFGPVKLESKHKGAEINGNSNYIVGKLYNAKNEGARIFINLENGKNGKVICDLSIKPL